MSGQERPGAVPTPGQHPATPDESRPRPDAPYACDARAGARRTGPAEQRRQLNAQRKALTAGFAEQRRQLNAQRNALMAELAEQRRQLAIERDAANGGRHLRRIKRRTWLRALALTAGLDERDRAMARNLARPGRMTADGQLLVDVPADLAQRLAAVDLLGRVGDGWVTTYLRGEPVGPRPESRPPRPEEP
jgi:hypothetical protein